MADLVAPITPTGSNPIVLEAIQKGFEGLAANRRYAQHVQLQLQQLAQQEELRKEQFGLEQQRIDNEWKVQQAQIGNYKSLEDERSQKIAELKEGIKSVGPLMQDIAAIPVEVRGTPEHEQKLAEIQAKYAQTPVFDTARGQQVWRGANLDLLRNQRQLNYTLGVLDKAYTNAFASKGIDKSVGDSLQVKDGEVQSNKYWGTNDDGSAYVAVGPGTDKNGKTVPGTGSIIPVTDAKKKSTADQIKDGIQFRTFSARAAKQLYEVKQKRDKLTNMLTGVPKDTVPDELSVPGDTSAPADTQFNQGTQLDTATATSLLNEAGGDKDKARQLARSRGYSF